MASPDEPPVLGIPIGSRLLGWFFSVMLFFSAFFGPVYVISLLLPLLFLSPRLWRRIVDRIIGLWMVFPIGMMSFLFGSKVSVKGHRIEHSEPALIIMNHRSRLDWLFFWNALFKMDPWLLTSGKIIMKGILKFVPGAGWAMSANAFIFLDRVFQTDASKLNSMINYYAEAGSKYQILLFPEGTDKCPNSTERSRRFAEKNALRHYDYVLHPRVTGFVHIVQAMRRNNYLKYIYDVTIGFGANTVQLESDLFLYGTCPKDIQYQVVKYPIESLPEDDEGLGRWLSEIWAQKEEKLKEFHAKPDNEREFPDVPGGEEFELSESTVKLQKLILALWIFMTSFWISALFEVNSLLIFSMLVVAMYVLIIVYCGGVEWLAVHAFNRSCRRQQQGPQDPPVLAQST